MFGRWCACGALFSIFLAGAQAQVALDRPARAPKPADFPIADGFDFPVGKPDAVGYYKARGFQRNGHPGEDWDGRRGGNSDLNDAVASIGAGVVMLAEDAHLGWGNVVIVRHCFMEDGALQSIDSFYAHLNEVLVSTGEHVARGQLVGTVGTAHGLYPAHLHFEIRKNLKIGINRSAFPQDFSCYYDPTKFIAAHRPTAAGLFACNRTLTVTLGDGRFARPKTASRTKSRHIAAFVY